MKHRGGHFVDRRRHLVRLALLAEHAMADFAHACRQTSSALIKACGRLGHGIDHPLITGLHGIECLGHLANLIFADQGHASGQVTGFFHVQHYILEGVEMAEQKANQQLRGAQHGQRQNEHRNSILDEAVSQHLQKARGESQHCQSLAIGASGHLSADQRIFTYQRLSA